ncbi:hypothetical protein SMICM17S_08679 [Streptomyces microflavus]
MRSLCPARSLIPTARAHRQVGRRPCTGPPTSRWNSAIREYLPAEGPASGTYRVVDLGTRISGKQTRTHRALLAKHPIDYFGVDVQDGPNVDAVMKKPYRIPARSNSADVVLSGQAFEHIPFFWPPCWRSPGF